ncbi:MAG: BrnT family toxin [Nitrososphaera sp.]|nr:BrnT family toxin [Blastocatellia bacterium]MCI0564540.1 BrnT family toxin [Nitrososphaera sp.]
MRVEWDESKAAQVEAERNISFDDVIAALSDPEAAVEYDEAHSVTEERYKLLGLSGSGLLSVIYTVSQDESGEIIKIITAWHATTREERIYEGEE